MQLVQISKIIQDNTNKFLSGELDKEVEVDTIAVKVTGGYVLSIKIGGIGFKVSSQREEYRIFKSLDTMVKTLKDIGISNISVCS